MEVFLADVTTVVAIEAGRKRLGGVMVVEEGGVALAFGFVFVGIRRFGLWSFGLGPLIFSFAWPLVFGLVSISASVCNP